MFLYFREIFGIEVFGCIRKISEVFGNHWKTSETVQNYFLGVSMSFIISENIRKFQQFL